MQMPQVQMFLLSSVKVWRLHISPESFNTQPLYLLYCKVTPPRLKLCTQAKTLVECDEILVSDQVHISSLKHLGKLKWLKS